MNATRTRTLLDTLLSRLERAEGVFARDRFAAADLARCRSMMAEIRQYQELGDDFVSLGAEAVSHNGGYGPLIRDILSAAEKSEELTAKALAVSKPMRRVA